MPGISEDKHLSEKLLNWMTSRRLNTVMDRTVNPKTAKEPESSEIIKQQGVALVSFCTAQSAPCTPQSSVLRVLAGRFGNQISITDIDVDDHHQLGYRFQITSIPTAILFKDGLEIERYIGLQKTEILSRAIKKALQW